MKQKNETYKNILEFKNYEVSSEHTIFKKAQHSLAVITTNNEYTDLR